MRKTLLLLACLLVVAFAAAAAESSVKATVDSIAGRLRDVLSEEQLLTLDEATLENFVTPEDKEVLATQHWQFDVDVPVVVYVMRETGQKTAPFWLSERGFEKTDMAIKSTEANMNFEVWRKEFGAGRIGLGINGFGKHRPHYFVAVKPQKAGEKVSITNPYPAWQEVHDLHVGSFYYHDWTELGVANVPDEMEGSLILPTKRGRAREAHFIGGFRKTDYPASDMPDQIALSPNDASPSDSMAVQWRQNVASRGSVRFRPAGEGAWQTVEATGEWLEDKFIVNDARVRRWTAVLENLAPGSKYEYCVQTLDGKWTKPISFQTAPQPGQPFTFVLLSDTHNKPQSGALVAKATDMFPDTSFITISGDLVNTGQYREDWDTFFHHGRGFYGRLPVAPAIGNHDGIDGLGVDLYLAAFDLPENGPDTLQPERAYSFTYGDAFFLVPDVIVPLSTQTDWIEEQLRQATAKWKFAVFHFPPYVPVDYETAVIDEWVPLFDKYHVDLALSGHVHHYVRTHPLKNGKAQDAPADGTIYVVTVSVPGRDRPPRTHPRAALMKGSEKALCNVFTIDGDRLTMTAIDSDGNVHDKLEIVK